MISAGLNPYIQLLFLSKEVTKLPARKPEKTTLIIGQLSVTLISTQIFIIEISVVILSKIEKIIPKES